ncbi:hypothetical protein ABSA28_00557 [Candidatus Hepatincolaceae symbiont of Richtersius coronifer]
MKDSFLKKDSSFKYLLDQVGLINDFNYLGEIKNYNQDISNITGQFLPLVLKALDLSSIVFFLNDGKQFFENFKLITTYDGFAGILKALFLTEKITIIAKNPCVLDIKVTNKNEALIAKYIDVNQALYLDNNYKNYAGFKSDTNSSLEAFFKRFLQRFLPAGVILNSITINSFTKGNPRSLNKLNINSIIKVKKSTKRINKRRL